MQVNVEANNLPVQKDKILYIEYMGQTMNQLDMCVFCDFSEYLVMRST